MPWRETQRTPKSPNLHHWINGEGISKIGWKNNKIFISQSDYDAVEDKTGKYSSDKIESYFTLFELPLTPRSNPLLAVGDLYLTKQGSMTSGEFHSHILKIVKRCQFSCQKAEERAIRDAIFMGMNSQRARDKAIYLMNEEGKEVTVEFLMKHLEHQPGQKCAAKNAKCKDCHKIGHFYKVCQSKKKTRRANLAQIAPQTEQDTSMRMELDNPTHLW